MPASLPLTPPSHCYRLLLSWATQDTWQVQLSCVFLSKTDTVCLPQLQLPRLCKTASLYSSTEKQNIPTPQNHGNLRENDNFLFFSPCSSLKWKYRVGRAHKSYITAVCKSTWWKITLFVLWLHNHLYMIVCALYTYGGRGWEYCCKWLCVCRQRAGCIIIHTVV